ncbi:hypothetical protein [Calidifontibacillus oryziterrae]|uniref:hypothetical protein n=1 Tax=Calidifontibacillus oryziterrae TaxID=1191699 RepID=UPI0002D35C18|nr:hypothetical protein [Calidifontibacillus oryziterrae]
MDKERKETVLKEIKYWKDHRLLPEHYCDFLISLYTEGSATEQEAFERNSFSFKRLFSNIFLLYLVLQLPLTYVVIYFTEMSFHLQIGLFTIFVLVCSGSTYYFYQKSSFFLHISIVIGALILFLASVHVVSSLFSVDFALIIIILTNCFMWIGIGYILRLKYLIISGIAGAIILITYIFL